MSKVNFVSEFIAIMRYARDYSLTLRERMLWIALFYAANDRAVYNEHAQEYDWPDGFFQVSNGELNLYSSLDKRAVETLRTALQQRYSRLSARDQEQAQPGIQDELPDRWVPKCT